MKNKQAFTLIELLVVVLIIGILAAVALPQYQKAVRKARLTQVHTTLNAMMEGIDIYLLEQGLPSQGEEVQLFGDHGVNLDLEIPCVLKDSENCFTDVGAWSGTLNYNGRIQIYLSTRGSANGVADNNWLDKGTLMWNRDWPDSSWKFDGIDAGKEVVCPWWRNLYGDEGFGDRASSQCANY